LEPNLAGMLLGWSSTKLLFFVPVGYSIWLPGPIICSDWHKKQKLGKGHSNDHSFTVWVQSVHLFQRRRSLKFQPIRAYYWPWQPYNPKVFCSDMKFKMAATAGLSLTLDPMGKMFQNTSSLKPLGQLKPNCPGMIIGRCHFNNFCSHRTKQKLS
jgi:hypothetical protein